MPIVSRVDLQISTLRRKKKLFKLIITLGILGSVAFVSFEDFTTLLS